MELKTIKPIKVLYYSERTNMSGLAKLVRIKAKELQIEAISKGMEITGPCYWNYFGMDANPETIFTLEIAMPVYFDGNYNGIFKIKKMPEFKCASAIHNGFWTEMGVAYQKLIGEILAKGFQMSGESREVYINIDFAEPKNNITEIQIGLK
jgi:effector-binding domain-containing protein